VESIADPFFAEVVDAIEAEMAGCGRAVLVASTHQDQPRQDAIVRRMVQRRTAGLIVVPTEQSGDWLQSTPAPVVLLDRGDPGSTADLVDIDDRRAAFDALTHLMRHGHRNIAYVGDSPRIPTSAARLQGYRDALEANGIAARDDLIAVTAGTPRDAAQVANALVDKAAGPGGPTAVFSASTRASLGIVPVLHSRQRTDLGFVGFGDFPLADALDPGVTVVDHSGRRIGQAAARRLLARLENPELPPEHLRLDTPLIVRGSGELRA
jgi:LacI family transcriptional regulator